MERLPDMLLIISDDHRWFDSGAYGNDDVHTPNLDALAAEGKRFDRYYTPAPMCAPGRMALYSGVFPVRNGAWPNHSQCYPGTLSMAHHLGGLGYRVGLHGKRHYGPESVFPFEQVGDVRSFIRRDANEPYCLVVATREPHAPWPNVDRGLYESESLTLAPNLVDTPETRRALARYYTALSHLDAKIGQLLTYVEDGGRSENTIVIYTSDHGAQFVGGKWTCYEPGLRVPFIVRWPSRVKPNSLSSGLMQHVDVLPTLLEAAGAAPTEFDTGRSGGPGGGQGFDGISFLQVMLGDCEEHRNWVYGVHTQHGTINGIPYPVRAIRNGRHKLIVNLCHDTVYRNVLTGEAQSQNENGYWHEWVKTARQSKRAAFLVERYLHRPAQELYDLERDPWELENRIDDPSLVDIRKVLERRLFGWMSQQGDRGIETELRALARRRA